MGIAQRIRRQASTRDGRARQWASALIWPTRRAAASTSLPASLLSSPCPAGSASTRAKRGSVAVAYAIQARRRRALGTVSVIGPWAFERGAQIVGEAGIRQSGVGSACDKRMDARGRGARPSRPASAWDWPGSVAQRKLSAGVWWPQSACVADDADPPVFAADQAVQALTVRRRHTRCSSVVRHSGRPFQRQRETNTASTSARRTR